jgi:MGT family glycosyltransferase
LLKRGLRVVFLIEESFQGTLAARGFEEELMRLKPKPAVDEGPGQFWKDFIRDTAPEFRKSTIDALETLTRPIWSELISGSMYVNERLESIFQTVQPTVIVQDNVIAFPAVLTAGTPWVRIVSCNPLEMPDATLPPVFSGLPSADHTCWERFRRVYADLHSDLHREFDTFLRDHGCPPLPVNQFMYESPSLNLYNYPAALDYDRSVPLSTSWHRLESSVRSTDAPFTLPEASVGRKTVYLSLGSLGSADTELMGRLIALLGRTDYQVIVSMGPQHEELRLAENMVGAEFLPQTSVLPQVDLVITHGGNNTVTESLHFGKPMIVLPLFWDQPDNAQRVQETGFGVRLDPYRFRDEDLLGWIDRLLADQRLAEGLKTISNRLQAAAGTVRAANLIEALARSRLPAAART